MEERPTQINILSKTQKPVRLTSMSDVHDNLVKGSFEYRAAMCMFADSWVPFLDIVNEDFTCGGYLLVDGSAMTKSEMLDWAEKARLNRFHLYVYNVGGEHI